MKRTVESYLEQHQARHSRRRINVGVGVVLSLFVAFAVVWQLHMTGIALAGDAFCGKEEHIHTQDCIAMELICTQEEGAAHVHGDECYEWLACTVPEHSHTDECFTPELELGCAVEAHVHTADCYGMELCCELVEHTHGEGCFDEDGALLCTETEHSHDESCYQQGELLCEKAEHSHTDACYTPATYLSCTLSEDEPHEHTEACYAPKLELVCTQEHEHSADCYDHVYICGLEAHVHSSECFSNINADVETAEDWTQTLPSGLTGIWTTDVLAVAQSQLGYTESTANFILNDSGVKQGYTRYGAWYGNDYGEWDAMFAAFCLHYGGVTRDMMPYNSGVNAWLAALDSQGFTYSLEEDEPHPGYLVFLDTDADGSADKVGIIVSADGAQMSVICGNLANEDGADRVGQLTVAYSDSRILAFSVLPFQEPVNLLDGISHVLEGDEAYIEAAYLDADSTTESGLAIRTGTTPWDNNSTDPGMDSSDLNNIVRSFDSINYTMELKLCTRGTQDYYREGWIYYEFILNCTGTEGYFDTGSMTWLDPNNMTVTTGTYNGETVQILRGKVYLTTPPNDGEIVHAPVFGNTLKQFTCNIQVLAAANGKKLQPKFTFWVENNAVPEEGLVTGSDEVCETHGEVEYKTIESPVITVTAAPRFNVALTNLAADVYGVVDYYDFSTGNETACNKGDYTVYGRQAMMGISVQMYGDKDRGLKGCEVPNGKPITFDFTLSNTYTNSDTNVTSDLTNTYTPLVWSYEGNTQNNNFVSADGRKVNISDGNAWFSANTGIPYNTYDPNYTTSPYNTYRKCHNGGTWSMTQTGNKVSVTITGYEVSPFEFPSCNPSMWSLDTTTGAYYNPQTQNPWMAWPAFFSTGEVWIIQPFNAVAADDTVKVDDYVVDQYGSGTFTTNVVEDNMFITTISGQTATSQRVTTDDARNTTIYLTQPGRISSEIMYTPSAYNYSSLTANCDGTGRDWAYQGNSLGIGTRFGQYSADSPNEIFAMDMLIKFDDAFFVPDGTKHYDDGRILFAAKPDKTGWNHNGLNPEDEGYDDEMRSAQIEDLIYFSSLSELREQGYTCVGAIRQYRGELNGLKAEVDFRIGGTVSENADVGSVYMTTFEHRGWIKANSAQAVATYVNKDNIEDLTDDDYKNYVTNAFPKMSGNGVTVDYSTYPTEASYVYGYNNIAAMQNYEKVSYDNSGMTNGSAGRNAADSCLVVSVISEIGKSIVQQSGGAAMQTFDMDNNQRVVDYVLTTKLKRPAGISTTSTAEYTTTVYVEDTLPASLTYIPGSSYWGGTYTQTGEGKQGTITDGVNIQPTVTENDDGTTTLHWEYEVTMTNETEQSFGPIYFSCDIGNPGEADDVQDNQDVNNTARIWTDDDKRSCDPALGNGNVASTSFKVKKTNQVSLVKMADKTLVELGEDVGFRLTVTNASSNPRDVKIVDVLPYAADTASTFTGPSYVTEMSDWQNLEGFTFYYTFDASYRNRGLDYSEIDFPNKNEWVLWTRNSDGTFTIQQDNFEPVAIAIVGTVPAYQSMKIHITTQQPKATPEAKVVNYMCSKNFEDIADSTYVARALSGLTWIDYDQDGIQDTNEVKLSGVTVTLQKWNPDNETYETVYVTNAAGDSIPAQVTTGNQMNLVTGAVTDLAEGKYYFYGLEAGTYRVVFSSGDGEILNPYTASPDNRGTDDKKDSDGIAEYNNSVLQQTTISSILMPKAEDMTDSFYESKYHDSGFYQTGSIVIQKQNKAGDELTGAKFKLEYKDADNIVHTAYFTVADGVYTYLWTEEESAVTVLEAGTVTLSNLPSMPYRTWILTEIEAPDGYNCLKEPVEFKVIDGTITIVTANSLVTVENSTITVTNTNGYKLPKTGGMGTDVFVGLGLALMAAPVLAELLRRRKSARAE